MATTNDSLLTTLPALLEQLDRPGDFFGAGVVELPVVRLAVQGVGPLGLPIVRPQAEALRAASEDAPYGRGTRTLVDQDVRRCGQIDAAAVATDDPRWRATLAAIVAAASKALGVEGAVNADLYKLLVYAPGDFFVEHRDTEKAPGMFATLVVALPSAHAGGELVVRHEGREVTLALSGDDLGVARWAAFYCDCVHELKPLREGYRVALVYNLVRRARGKLRAPDASPVVAKLTDALSGWKQEPEAPVKCVIPLEHRYSLAELDFSALKNYDASAAQALVRAAALADCTVRLAMLSITESGAAEPIWKGRHKEAESYEVVEVSDRTCVLHTWRAPDGGREDYGAIEVDDETEIAPPGALEDAEPDEDQLHEATGNGGASFERTYRWAALVLWPDAHEADVLAQGGIAALLGAVERYLTSNRERARALAERVVSAWSAHRAVGPDAAARHARALRLFLTLGDQALVIALIEAITSAGGLSGAATAWIDGGLQGVLGVDFEEEEEDEEDEEDEPPPPVVERGDEGASAQRSAEIDAMVSALASLPATDAQRVATALVRARGGSPFFPLARLLRDGSQARHDGAMAVPVEALTDAFAAMKRTQTWGSEPYAERVKGLVELLCAAQLAGGAALVTRVAQKAVEAREAAPFDDVLVPCALALKSASGAPSAEATAPITKACEQHLEARCALPLAPPTDATRETDGLTCACRDCTALKAFLRDPVATRWQLKAVQQARSHVEEKVRIARVDLVTGTLRSGSPQTLVCTKTTARYDARVAQRAADTAALAALRAGPSRATRA